MGLSGARAPASKAGSAVQPIPLTALNRGTAFEMLPMPAFIKDRDLVFTHANRALCDLLGCRPEDIVGGTTAGVALADDLLHKATDRRLLARGGTETSTFRLARQGKGTICGEVFKMRLDAADGSPVGLLGVLIDRTEQLAAERRLEETEALHRMVVESISDPLFLFDEEGRFTFVAPNVATIFGIGPAEAMARGTLSGLLRCGSRGDLRFLPRDRETRDVECSIERPDGTRRDIIFNAKPIEIGASRWLVTCHDVTERVEALKRLKASMVKTVQALCATVERRDPYVVGHQERVADLAVAIGRGMGLDEHRLEGLRLAAIVHDIGKINVPSEILNKPGKLTAPELAIIQTHAQVGYEILKDIEFPWPVARMVREHHEAVDGSGYPRGLTGDRLLTESRILSVADVLEAVTSHRPYRPGLGLEKGLEVLRQMRGSKLDPEAVDVCLDLIERRQVTVPGWTNPPER